MTRTQVRQKNFVNGMTLKIKPSLDWKEQAAAAEAEKKRQSEDRRKEKQEKQRRSKEAESAAQAELGLPVDGHGPGRLPANVYVDADGFRLSKAQIDQAWEHVTQAGVAFWLNAATGEAQFENPTTGKRDEEEAEEVDEEIEIAKILGGGADGDDDGDDFLSDWVNQHATKARRHRRF